MNSTSDEGLSTIQRHSVQELAYRKLRSAILTGVLKAGERLLPSELARRFSVSPTPVIQALMRLQAERLVVRMKNRGLTVATLSVDEMEEVYSLRAVLEGYAARLATPKLSQGEIDALSDMVQEMESLISAGSYDALVDINTRFHFTIYRAAGNQHLYGLLKNLWDQSMRYRHIYYSHPRVPEQTIREHRAILTALQHKDASEAEMLVRSARQETADTILPVIRAASASGEQQGHKTPEME